MARVVRKVSGKAVKGQKKQGQGLLKSKKFWIASIISVLVIIGTVVGLCIWLNSDDEIVEEATVNEVDYFRNTYELDENGIYNVSDKEEGDNLISFEYSNHQGLKNYLNDKKDSIQKDNIIVFAYNMDSFYADKENDGDNYNEKYSDLIQQICKLKKVIDDYNNSEISDEEKIYFYVVNLNVGTNNKILEDEIFIGSKADNKLTIGDVEEFEGPLITSVFDGEFVLEATVGTGENAKKKPISSVTVTNSSFAVINNLVNYINSL